MRKEASGWEEDNAGKLANDGFKRGRGAPTIFYQLETHVRAVVHGDDYHVCSHRNRIEEESFKDADAEHCCKQVG